MSQPGFVGPAPNAWTFVTANIAVANSIKTSIATTIADINYSGATLNGASKTPAPDGKAGFAQWPTATASSSSGVFVNNSVIRFTATYKGRTVVRTATVVGTDGNATFIADGPVDGAVTNIFVSAQATTGGTWTFGFTDLECIRRGPDAQQEPFRMVRGGSAGNIGFYRANGEADILPCVAGEQHAVLVQRIKHSTTTCTPITVYE